MKSSNVILDSSCWIEYFLGSPFASPYAEHVTASTVLVPTIILFEVSRKLLQSYPTKDVLSALSLMKQQRVLPLTEAVALDAAQLAEDLSLSSADAILCAIATSKQATLFTHDVDLKGLHRVEFLPKT